MMILPDPEEDAGYVIMEKGSGKILHKLSGEAAELVSSSDPS